MLWCIFGIADLVAAITLGILNSRSSLGLLAGGVTTAPMSTFPLSLIPTYLVPVSVVLHLITLRRVLGSAHERSTDLDVPRVASAR